LFQTKQMEINRLDFLKEIQASIRNNQVTAIMGPRQCGKTTLARAISQTTESTIFDLEDPTDYDLLSENPKITHFMLSALDGLKLDKLCIVYKGHREISFEEKITAIPVSNIFDFDF
jgi:ABC-type lipoprotein export system ATPase subunit